MGRFHVTMAVTRVLQWNKEDYQGPPEDPPIVNRLASDF